MTDHTCQFLDGGCTMLARHLWRWSCPACGFFDIRQICDEHTELIEHRVDHDTTVTHQDMGKGCMAVVRSKSFYTYVGKA